MKLFISCAEPSGDLIAAEILHTLKRQGIPLDLAGIGGTACEKEGLMSLFPMGDLTVYGIVELLPKLSLIKKRLKETVRYVLNMNPCIVMTVDAYGFHSRLAKSLRRQGFKGKLVHVVAPTVWAWREKRAKTLTTLYDALYCLLPFEPLWFKNPNFEPRYVGNPVLKRFSGLKPNPNFREQHKIPESALILTLLPGSRFGEVKRLLKDFMGAAYQLREKIPSLHVCIPTFDSFLEVIGEVPYFVTILSQKEKYDCFMNTDLAIAASGTVTLELAMFEFPFIAAYKVSPLTAWIMKRLVKVEFFSLINIISKSLVIPEFMQETCTPTHLAKGILTLLDHQEEFNEKKQKALALLETEKEMGDTIVSYLFELLKISPPC